MPVHFYRELDHLKKRILVLGTLVEENLQRAIGSLETWNEALLDQIKKVDEEIDDMEVGVEEECLKILALYQPVAVDLRFIVAVLKINNDLERVGDLAVNIGERSASLGAEERRNIPPRFHHMVEKVQAMLRDSLTALIQQNADLARSICEDDREVDAINQEMFAYAKQEIQKRPQDIDSLLRLSAISKHLERVADLATNIAEDLIYFTEGEIVRHYASGN